MRPLRQRLLLGAIVALVVSTVANAADTVTKVRFLGINGFEFKIGDETLLVDPYVSRDPRRVSIPEVVRKHIKQADYIVLTHSHWDHLADVPEIAKYTDAIIVGSQTTLNICRHFRIAESRLRQVESRRTLRLGSFSLTPLRSRHKEPVGYPGSYDHVPERIDKVSDFVEGGTWALLLTGGGQTFLNIGSANLVDAELQGTKCDYLLASIAGRAPDYLSRLFECVDAQLFIPTHWDNFIGHPVEKPGERISLSDFHREIQRVAPSQPVQVLKVLETIEIPAPNRP